MGHDSDRRIDVEAGLCRREMIPGDAYRRRRPRKPARELALEYRKH
jgi:hypothetical protein